MPFHFSTGLHSRRLRHRLVQVALAASLALTVTLVLSFLLPDSGTTALAVARDLAAGEKIDTDDLVTVHLSSEDNDSLPAEPADLRDQYTLVAIPKGSIIALHDVTAAPPLADNETVVTVAAASTTAGLHIGQSVTLLPLTSDAQHRTTARIMPGSPATPDPTTPVPGTEGFTPLSVAVSVDDAAQLLADSQQHGLLVVGGGVKLAREAGCVEVNRDRCGTL